MTHRPGILRRFRFNRPQRIAAGLLALFLVQGSVLIGRQALSDRDYEYARCGREMWEKPSPLAGYFTTCGNIHDGVLAYRLAGLPLTLNLLVERGLDLFRKQEDRVIQTGPGAGGEVNIWELRHQLTHISLLLRLPFLAAGCLLGGCLWWVTRRLFGNRAGYMALGLYCFSPAILRACAAPNAEVLAGLGVFGGIYTCIGVAHAMQGPRRKWRPVHPAAHGDLRRGGSVAYRGAAPRGTVRNPGHAVGGGGAQEPRAPHSLDVFSGSAGAVVRLLRILTRRIQLRFPVGIRVSFRLARSCAAILLFVGQCRGHLCRGPGCCALSHPSPVALLRQHNSAALRFGIPCASDDRHAVKSVAVVAAVSVHVHCRRVCRRIRHAGKEPCIDRRSVCAGRSAGRVLSSQPVRASGVATWIHLTQG